MDVFELKEEKEVPQKEKAQIMQNLAGEYKNLQNVGTNLQATINGLIQQAGANVNDISKVSNTGQQIATQLQNGIQQATVPLFRLQSISKIATDIQIKSAANQLGNLANAYVLSLQSMKKALEKLNQKLVQNYSQQITNQPQSSGPIGLGTGNQGVPAGQSGGMNVLPGAKQINQQRGYGRKNVTVPTNVPGAMNVNKPQP